MTNKRIDDMVEEIKNTSPSTSFISEAMQKCNSQGEILDFYTAYNIYLRYIRSKPGHLRIKNADKYALKRIAENIINNDVSDEKIENWKRALPSLEHYLYCLKEE